MSGNLGKGAMNLQGWVRYVQSADRMYRAKVVAAVFGALGVEAGAELTQAGLEQELGWRATLLETRRAAHFDAELAYAAEQSDDPMVREELEAAEAALREDLIAERALFTGNFGESVTIKAGLSSATPLGGDLMVAYASNFIVALKADPKRTNRHGTSVDLKPNLKVLESGLARVKQAQDAMLNEAKELQEARQARDGAAEALRAAYVQVASYYESVFRMAGLHDMADQLRPTARRATSVEEPLAPIPLEPLAGA